MRPNAGGMLCLFYERAYICEGQLHSHFVIGFYFSYSLSFYKLGLWKEKRNFTFICIPSFSLLTTLFKRLLLSLWQIPRLPAFRPACCVLQHANTLVASSTLETVEQLSVAVRGSKPTVSEKWGKISRLLLSSSVVVGPRLIIPRPLPVSMNVFFVSKDYDASSVFSSAASQTQTPVISTGLVLAPVNSCQAT